MIQYHIVFIPKYRRRSLVIHKGHYLDNQCIQIPSHSGKDERNQLIRELYNQKYTQDKIASFLGISQATVSMVQTEDENFRAEYVEGGDKYIISIKSFEHCKAFQLS